MRKRFLSFFSCNNREIKDTQPAHRTRSESSVMLQRPTTPSKRSISVKDTEIYGYSMKGLGSDKPECQDSFAMLENIMGHISYVGIYDGHGPRGKDVSNFVNQQIEDCLKANGANLEKALLMGSQETFFRTMIRNVENKLYGSTIDLTSSGTTCLGIFVVNGKCHILNIGDSRAVLCKQISKGLISAVNLSQDHKPTREDEKARVLQAGGAILPTAYIDGEPISPLRIWSPNRDTGLSMTRALGNKKGLQAGLISEPEIFQYTFEQNDKFIIAATDGIWDVMSSEEACTFVSHHVEMGKPKSEAAKALVKEARSRWENLEEYEDDPYSDDITAIITFVKPLVQEIIPTTTTITTTNLDMQPPGTYYYYYNNPANP